MKNIFYILYKLNWKRRCETLYVRHNFDTISNPLNPNLYSPFKRV